MIALADADCGGKMKDRIDALQTLIQRLGVAQIFEDKLHIVVQVVGPIVVSAVNLRRKNIQDTDMITVRQ